MKFADEARAGAVHEAESYHPEQERACHEIDEVLHEDVGCVL